ncbi:MAG: hypothetical protein KDJ42_07815 [Alphaproteobacteria bacterium]|nr:hypothetical protein [Alphaproteobacteria bacterium]
MTVAAPAPTVQTTASFNRAAMVSDLEQKGLLVEETGVTGWFGKLGSAFGMAGAGVDWKATFVKADADATLDALKAGGSDEVDRMIDAIRGDKEVKDAFHKVLQNEGQNGLLGLQKMMTGNGSITADELNNVLNDKTQRKALLAMLKVVATDKQNMDYAARFMKAGVDLARDPGNPEKLQAMQKVMKEGGISNADLIDPQIFITFLADSLTDPQGAVNGLMAELKNMGMSPEALAALEKYANFASNFMQAFGGDFKEFYDVHGPTISRALGTVKEDVQTVSDDIDRLSGVATAPAKVSGHKTTAVESATRDWNKDMDITAENRETFEKELAARTNVPAGPAFS